MEITVWRTGGIGSPATDVAWGPVDTEAAGSAGAELERLVKSVDFFELKDFPEDAVADDFHYRVQVVDGERQHTVSYGDVGNQVPADLREIVKLVAQTAEPARA